MSFPGTEGSFVENAFSFLFVAMIFCIIFLVIVNGISVLSCYGTEGKPYWNTIVFACHYNDTGITISQTIITQNSLCFKNGVSINCSEID